MPKISALRANCGQIPSFCQISDRKNREEISNFRIWEGEKIRIFGQNIYPCYNMGNMGNMGGISSKIWEIWEYEKHGNYIESGLSVTGAKGKCG